MTDVVWSGEAPVVELRQYTLRTGQRDALIDLFDREFVEAQEVHGISLLAQFRDLDDPNRFVWLRAFPNMTDRANSLGAFYGGPVWKAHRDAANATMLDSDNVLLLRPSSRDTLAEHVPERRPVAHAGLPAFFTISIQYVPAALLPAFGAFFESVMMPMLTASGAAIVGRLQTLDAENTFPALPIRSGESVFVWISRYADGNAYVRALEAAERGADWRAHATAEIFGVLARRTEMLRLIPTPRSRLQ